MTIGNRVLTFKCRFLACLHLLRIPSDISGLQPYFLRGYIQLHVLLALCRILVQLVWCRSCRLIADLADQTCR